MHRRFLILTWILAWLALPALATGVPYARDLGRDAEAAQRIQGAVLVVFVSEHCVYCKTVLNDFLIPMSRLPEYRDKVVIRRVEISGKHTLRNFQGLSIGHRAFAHGHNVRFTPTIMLFSPAGEVLTQPMVGLSTIDYYWYQLDELINEALAKVRGTPLPAARGTGKPAASGA